MYLGVNVNENERARVMVDDRGCIECNIVHCFVKNTFIYICDKTGEFNGGEVKEEVEEETITHIHKAFAVSVYFDEDGRCSCIR